MIYGILFDFLGKSTALFFEVLERNIKDEKWYKVNISIGQNQPCLAKTGRRESQNFEYFPKKIPVLRKEMKENKRLRIKKIFSSWIKEGSDKEEFHDFSAERCSKRVKKGNRDNQKLFLKAVIHFKLKINKKSKSPRWLKQKI